MELLVLWIFLAVVSIHICSLLEITLFSVRISTLIDRRSSGSAGAALLLGIKQHRIDDAIAAILILNTLAGTVGSTLAGARAAELFGQAGAGFLAVGLTVLLLVISEIVPKTMAARYAGSISAFAGYALSFLITLLAPVLVVTRALVRLLARRPREHFTRREFAILVGTAPHEGAISLSEAKLIGSLIYSREVTLKDVMTPASVIFMMDADQTAEDLLMAPGAEAFSRIPLFKGERRHVIGYVSHREVLRTIASGKDKDRKLETFLHPLPVLSETVQVAKALEEILRRREAIALVTRKRGELAGLVTLEDLLEAILGMEITDEADAVASLRPAVAESRRRRTERLRRDRIRQDPRSD